MVGWKIRRREDTDPVSISTLEWFCDVWLTATTTENQKHRKGGVKEKRSQNCQKITLQGRRPRHWWKAAETSSLLGRHCSWCRSQRRIDFRLKKLSEMDISLLLVRLLRWGASTPWRAELSTTLITRYTGTNKSQGYIREHLCRCLSSTSRSPKAMWRIARGTSEQIELCEHFKYNDSGRPLPSGFLPFFFTWTPRGNRNVFIAYPCVSGIVTTSW